MDTAGATNVVRKELIDAGLINPQRKKEIKLSKNILTFKQKMVVYERLKKLLVTDASGAWRYVEGWSDERVAQEVHGTEFACTTHNVSGLREEMFGKLAKPMTEEDQLILRVKRCEKMITLLAEQEDLEDEWKNIYTGLGD